MEDYIIADNIAKVFGDKTVLDGVSLTVGRGEIFGLLGPSGAGKTTLIKILTGQLVPDIGIAEINGTLSRKMTGRDHKKIGIMMDNFGIYERFSCYENLKIFARIYGIENRDITRALEKVGLAGVKKRAASRLSKGMQSRLRLARVFMTDPDVMFLDEPTSGLDPTTANEIHKMLLAEKERGKTIFLTTHAMAEAEKLCDRIGLIDDGKIIEYDSPQEICRRYNHQRMLKIHLADGTDIEIPHNGDAADRVAELIRDGRAETIHTTEPNLETVFIELTGKELEV